MTALHAVHAEQAYDSPGPQALGSATEDSARRHHDSTMGPGSKTQDPRVECLWVRPLRIHRSGVGR